MLPVPRSGLATHVDTRLLVPGGPSPAQRVPEPPDPASPPSPRASRPGLPAVSPRLPTRLPRHLPESPDLASPPSPRASRPGFRAVSPSLQTWPPRRVPEQHSPSPPVPGRPGLGWPASVQAHCGLLSSQNPLCFLTRCDARHTTVQGPTLHHSTLLLTAPRHTLCHAFHMLYSTSGNTVQSQNSVTTLRDVTCEAPLHS